MKKGLVAIVLLSLIAVFAVCADAEVSDRLQAEYSYSKSGLIQSVRYLDRDGNLAVAEDLGYAQVIYTYKATRPILVEYQDAAGNPVNSAEGFCRCAYEYSGTRVVSKAYYTADGRPAVGPEGYAVEETAYTDGKISSVVHYGTNGQLVSAGSLYARFDRQYKAGPDGKLHLMSEQYTAANGSLFACSEGWGRVEYEYSYNYKYTTVTRYIGPDGKLVMNPKKGYAVCVSDVNLDKISSTKYYDENNRLINGPSGWASCVYTYTSTSVTKRYFTSDGKGYVNSKGYCGVTQISKSGRVTEEYYLDENGSRTMIKAGYAGWQKTFATGGKVGKQVYVDTNGKPVNVPSLGYAQFNRTYSNKLLAEEYYFDASHNPVECANGYHKVVYTYDKNKRVIEEWYYSASGTRTRCSGGYAGKAYEYDFAGRTTKVTYFDSTGKNQF